MTRLLRLCHLGLCAALVGWLALPAPAQAHEFDLRAAARGAGIHKEPDSAQAPVGYLREGQQVQVLQVSSDGQWLQIAKPDGTVLGYVPVHALPSPETVANVEVANMQPGARAGSGGLFARSLGVAGAPDSPPAAAGPVPMPSEGSVFGSRVLRGDIDAAHAQRREAERVAAQHRAEEERSRQIAEAQRAQQLEQERQAQAARERRQQQQREYERAQAEAESDRARQRQWAAIQSSVQRMTQDVQRETDKTRRLLEDRARQQEQERRDRVAAQERAREQAQSRTRADAQSEAQVQAEARARAQEATRVQEQAARERARQQALVEARQRATVAEPPAGLASGQLRVPAIGALAPAVPIAAASPALARPSTRPAVPASGTSGAEIRLASVQRTPGDRQPGRGSMRKHGLRVGACAVDSIQVEWALGVLMGEATVMGTYTWEGDANCKLPSSTVVLLRLDAPGLPSGWVAVNPVVPPSGEAGINVTGSPPRSALLCEYDDARRGNCLSADAARGVWTGGQVNDFVVAW